MRIKADSATARRRDLTERYVHARALADQYQEQVKKAEAELIAELEAQEKKSSSVGILGISYTTTMTSRTTTSFNETGLKKALGARVFNKLTVPKVDRAKLSAALEEGIIDAGIVSQHTTITPGDTTIRLTKKADSDEQVDEQAKEA